MTRGAPRRRPPALRRGLTRGRRGAPRSPTSPSCALACRRRSSSLPRRGTRASVCRRVSSIHVAPSAAMIATSEQPGEVGHRRAEEQKEHDDRERDVRPHAVLKRRRDPAASGERASPGAGEPRGDEEEEPDDDHEPERAAHEVGEDVPRVVRSLAIVVARRRARRPRSSASDSAATRPRSPTTASVDADAAYSAAAVAGEPDGEPERRERQQREHPGERLQELERVLRGVELVRAQDHDLAGVRRESCRRPGCRSRSGRLPPG